MINLFKHLLPRAEAWLITVDKDLRKLFESLAIDVASVREFFDLMWLDMFPDSTRELTAWESQFGLFRLDLTETQRRDRIDALWKARGGQSPRYIQDTLRNAGFDVYVHDWWETPAADPPVARNPFEAFGATPYGCGDTLMQCGELIAQCGNSSVYNGYALVNKLYTTRVDLTCLCGEALMQCGEPTAQCGENAGIIFDRVEYPIPHDRDLWPYFMYIGGQTFGDTAVIAASRFDEFEDLCLKICPAHLWIGLLIDYTSYIIEDATGEYVQEDATGDRLIQEIF